MAEHQERDVHINDADQNELFCSNRVVTSKYTVVNFLPKFLFEALKKFANSYFLLVSMLQMVPSVTTTNGIPYNLLPLTTVLSIEGIAAILEDRRRHRDDKVANSSKAKIIGKNGSIITKEWHEIKVGDIVKLHNRESIPADCFILACSDSPPAAVCYVETKSLDGETNLKLRQGIEDVAQLVNSIAEDAGASGEHPHDKYDFAISKLKGHVQAERVNNQIHSFNGTALLYKSGEKAPENSVPLNINHMLLRGCVLRNTDFAYVLVVNTGHDTKIMQNSHMTRGKLSLLDKAINRNILIFVLAEFLLCLGASYLSSQWENDVGIYSAYLGESDYDASDFISRTFTFFLLIANMIPISLYVAMKFARFFQSFFIFWDNEMKFDGEDPSTGEPKTTSAAVRTMDLNDSLGEVSYIFSDKTGTLTNNVMEFRKCAINGKVYGTGTTIIGAASLERRGEYKAAEEARAALKESALSDHPKYVNFVDDMDSSKSITNVLCGPASVERKQAREFMVALALCHSVLIERVRNDDGEYTGDVRLSAASPDDQALVAAAKEFGFSFEERTNGGKSVVVKCGPPTQYISNGADVRKSIQRTENVTYELLEILEFTSKRKRMSVIVRDNTGTIRLISKGADSEIFKRVCNTTEKDKALLQQTSHSLLEFANDGLRTLAVASKVIGEAEFKSWRSRFHAALSSLEELEKQKNKEENLIDKCMDEIETELVLLGATAIEDKLQEGVPEAISTLSEAGIKIWVLTGDKEETAINIGFACQLLDNSMERMIINSKSGSTSQDIEKLLDAYLNEYENYVGGDKESDLALIIDGDALKLALEPGIDMKLLSLARRCKAVIACRTSPKQKSEIVNLVKLNEKDAKTLAIGDGANDVSMIQTAHIGIGISGQEGLQAVNSSDYSIAQFAFLERLLLVHGRSNYRRMTKLVSYMFYKNVLLILSQLWYANFSGFSGQKIYLELGLQGFNLIFTNFPIFLMAIYDIDLPPNVVLKHPRLYELGLHATLFNFKVFWQSVLNGVFQSFVVFGFSYYVFDPVGHDLWLIGCIIFTVVCFVANINAALIQSSWHWSNILMWVLTVASWPVFALVMESSFFLETFTTDFGRDWNNMYTYMQSRPDAWLVIFVIIVIANGRDFTWKAIKRNAFTQPYHIFQEMESLGKSGELQEKVVPDTGSKDMVRIRVSSTASNKEPYRGASFESDDATEQGRADMIRRGSIQSDVPLS